MPPVTPRQLKSCLSSSSPSDFSSPADSSLDNTPAVTATPPTPYSSMYSPCYTTPTPVTRRQKKSVRFHPEAEVKEFRQVREIKEVRTRTSSSGSTSTSTKRKFREEVKVQEKVVEGRVSRKVEKKEEVVEVRKGKKRKESQDESYYYESTSNEIMKSGITGLGITVDGSYGPPTKAPPRAPLPPRPAKRERTKYSQSPITKSDEPKLTCSFDDSTSTSSYPNLSFGQAPPPPVPTEESSFTELANYPPVPQIMSTGLSFTEQQEQAAWWTYQEPAPQPPVAAAASSRPLRRKRSFEPRRQSCESAPPPVSPEIVDVESMRSRRGSTIKSTSSTSSKIPSEYAYKEAKVEKPSRSSRRRREEENWEEQYRMESLKRQARQKTRDREVKKNARTERSAALGSFDRDAGSGYFNNKGPAYSFNASDGYDGYF